MEIYTDLYLAIGCTDSIHAHLFHLHLGEVVPAGRHDDGLHLGAAALGRHGARGPLEVGEVVAAELVLGAQLQPVRRVGVQLELPQLLAVLVLLALGLGLGGVLLLLARGRRGQY